MLTLPLPPELDRPDRLFFSPDAGLVAVIGGDRAAVYDVSAGRLLVAGQGFVGSFRREAAFATDGRTLLAGNGAHGIDVLTGRLRFGGLDARPFAWLDRLPPLSEDAEGIPFRRCEAVSADRRWAVIDCGESLVDLATGRVARLGRLAVATADGPAVRLRDLYPLAFGPTGEWVVYRDRGRLVVFGTAALAAASSSPPLPPPPAPPPLPPPPPPPSGVFARLFFRRPTPPVADRPDDWHVPPLPPLVPVAPTAVLTVPVDCADAATATPDGRTLLAAGADGLVRTWGTDGWREGAGFDCAAGGLHSVAVSPDGLLAAAAGSKAIVVWDLD